MLLWLQGEVSGYLVTWSQNLSRVFLITSKLSLLASLRCLLIDDLKPPMEYYYFPPPPQRVPPKTSNLTLSLSLTVPQDEKTLKKKSPSLS